MDDYEEVPYADPAIRAEYEAALGSFLVQFNRFENLVGDLLEQSFEKLNAAHLYERNDRLESKLRLLEVVGLALPGMHRPDFKAAKTLAGERNTLAHGHFDQNPFSGDYKIVTKRGRVPMPVGKIRKLATEAEAVVDDFRGCEAYLAFHDISTEQT